MPPSRDVEFPPSNELAAGLNSWYKLDLQRFDDHLGDVEFLQHQSHLRMFG
jgi:hypothetical protein